MFLVYSEASFLMNKLFLFLLILNTFFYSFAFFYYKRIK